MDFYLVLGLSRGAASGDIKRAYRRLARRWHPDINPGDRDAAVQFRQVLDAYETLMDPDRRQRYDLGQLATVDDEAPTFGFAGFDFSHQVHAERTTTFGELFEEVFVRRSGREAEPDAAGERGADIYAHTGLDFDEAWHGVERVVSLTRRDTCGRCQGSGTQPAAETRCLACEGTGAVRSVRGHMVFSKHCPHCEGAGRLRQRPCQQCGALGVETRTEMLTVRIAPGVEQGARVRVAGKGHAGLRGGAAGDLLLDVTVSPDERYRRDGDDLHMVVPIAIHEAGLGVRLEVVTPDGPTRVRVPAGTQSGQRFRLRDRGAPTRAGRRGDLVVEVRLRMPRLLDERSKELLREFGRLNGESVRD